MLLIFIQSRNLECTEDVVVLSEDPNQLQPLPHYLNDNVCMFETRFAISKGEMRLQDQNSPKPNPLGAEESDEVGKLNCICYITEVLFCAHRA